MYSGAKLGIYCEGQEKKIYGCGRKSLFMMQENSK